MSSQTLERPAKQTIIVQGSHTLGKVKKSKTSQRHSAGNIDYDNISQEADDVPSGSFRTRSKTVGDSAGMFGFLINSNYYHVSLDQIEAYARIMLHDFESQFCLNCLH